ncbi:Nn.00g089710.m01.CDS01 [Neocucurbitaria sp. VM-36]
MDRRTTGQIDGRRGSAIHIFDPQRSLPLPFRRSLIIKLPLPENMKQRPRDSLSSLSIAPAVHDRAFWTRLITNPRLLSTSDAIQALGLKRLNPGGRGKPKFETSLIRQLASAVADVAAKLPIHAGTLIDVADDVTRLDNDITQLLDQFGAKIWGRNCERTYLLSAANNSEGYQKDLIYEEPADHQVLKHHLRIWVLLKAFNALRNGIYPSGRQIDTVKDSLRLATAQTEKENEASQLATTLPFPPDSSFATSYSGSSSTIRPSSSIFNPRQATNYLPLDRYWDETIWRRFISASTLSMRIFVSCLGLKFRHVRGCTVFDWPAAKSLEAETARVATRLYAQLSPETLVACAANPDILDEDIDVLLAEYAPQLWGMDADRSGLLKAGVDDTYMKDLVYEDDEDRKLLWLHLHRWIFAQAFSMLRKWGSSDEVKQGIVAALHHDPSPANTFKVPERSYMLTPIGVNQVHEHSREQEPSIPLEEYQPKPVQGHETRGSAFQRRETSTTADQHQKLLSKRHKADAPTPTFKTPSLEVSTFPASLPNTFALTTTFLSYLQDYGQSDYPEVTMLNSINNELDKVTSHLPKLLENEPYGAAFSNVFAGWVTYRRIVHAIGSQITALQAERLNNIQLKIKRARCLIELRNARHELIAKRSNDTSVEEIICMIFGRLQRTIEEGEKTMVTIREGFKKLDERLVEVGDLLGGGEWLVTE